MRILFALLAFLMTSCAPTPQFTCQVVTAYTGELEIEYTVCVHKDYSSDS